MAPDVSVETAPGCKAWSQIGEELSFRRTSEASMELRYENLAIGLITCRRTNVDVHDTVAQLRRAGFPELLHMFCEPGTPPIRHLPRLVVHQNDRKLGCVGNWAHCLRWLWNHTSAEYILICEDDIAFCQGARAALNIGLHSFDRVGFWSLYTPQRDEGLVGHQYGWVAANRGRDAWGTQAMCFPRSSAQVVLDYAPLHNEDQLRGPTDAIVAQCFVEARLPCYYHNPSLTDHLGRISAIGNNWHDNHVGLDFDPEFQPVIESNAASAPTLPAPFHQGLGGPVSRAAVVTVFQDNIPPEVVGMQAEVICRFLPSGCDFESVAVGHHALGLDDYFRSTRHDAYLVLDIDCIPLTSWVISWMFEQAYSGILVGAAQRANHISNGNHLYAGPCALAFSRNVWERLGGVSFRATDRGDVAEEITYACEGLDIPVSLLWPTRVKIPKWTLLPNIEFGLGTTYGGAFFHAFEISKGHTVGMFLEKCREVLGQLTPPFTSQNTLDWLPSLKGDSTAVHSSRPVFHEQWYAEGELTSLEAAVRFVKPLDGAIVELGCWEGRSTAVIANACFPEVVTAVDTWQGSLSESPTHETVRLARERDVFATFQENMRILTSGNVAVQRVNALEFLSRTTAPIKFCHIDAAHDFVSVKETLRCLVPRLVAGGILFGHDFQSAHAGRRDLDGGVERAVRETLPYFVARGNTWSYVKAGKS